MNARNRTAVFCTVLAAALIAFEDSPARAAAGVCAHPVTGSAAATASDALLALRASVGLVSCNVCVCDVDNSGSVNAADALKILQEAVGLSATNDCPACDLQGLACPAVVQFALLAKIRGACSTNADCPAFSACDTSVGRCRTVTESNVGWTGFAHHGDIDDPIPSRFFLDCDGPAPCGQCTITGHDPSLHNCRCINDNRTACFTVAGPDQENCGGEMCVCYFGPPMPLSAGNVPTCVLNSLADNPTGTGDVDLGIGMVHLHLAEKVFLGLSLTQPCPLCVNDPHPADGVREGTCVGGLNDTQSCDQQAYNSTFPPPTGALYSLDCFPEAGANITGPGLLIPIDLTTGRSELRAEVPCTSDGPGSEISCPCHVCSGDDKIACNRDADCSAAGAGTCSAIGNGASPAPNECIDNQCAASDGQESTCATGPDDTWCDLLVRADGRGLIACATNADCSPLNIGVDAGNCTISERRSCLPDPIVTSGHAHPVVPVAAGTFCSPPTSSAGVNQAVGLPGPGSLILQTAVSMYCKSDPNVQYTPGTGGCP